MKISCKSCTTNLEAYALDALAPSERTRVERHLLRCESCRRVHASIRRVTNFLPFLSEPAAPSPAAKARLFERIAEGEVSNVRVMTGNPWVSSQTSISAESAESGVSGNLRRGIWRPWMASGLIAALILTVLVMSAWVNALQHEVSDLRARDVAPEAMTTAHPPQANLQFYDFRPVCETCGVQRASGQLGGHPDSSVGVVVAWNLDPNEKHEVWCIDSQGEKQLVSALNVEQTGSVFQTVSFPQPLGGYEQIYVARQVGADEPVAELLVATNKEHEAGAPEPQPDDPASN